MGIYYSAVALYGVRIDARMPKKELTVRGCHHNLLQSPDVVFCHVCGEKAWLTKCVEEDVPDFHEIFENLPKGYVYNWDYSQETFYVGWGFEVHRDDWVKMATPNLDEVQEVLKGVLEPLGFWNPETFGLYITNFGH